LTFFNFLGAEDFAIFLEVLAINFYFFFDANFLGLFAAGDTTFSSSI